MSNILNNPMVNSDGGTILNNCSVILLLVVSIVYTYVEYREYLYLDNTGGDSCAQYVILHR